MDGLQAFSFICDNLPKWQEQLDELAKTVHERHTEFRRLSVTSSGGSSLRRHRTGSTESLRPQNEAAASDNDEEAAKPVTPPMHVAVDPGAKRLFQEYRLQAKRKRASGSVISNASGTTVPRSRMSLIVFYDSSIQDGFEKMVRGVAAARNNLRKGKTAASMRARMSSMTMEESPFEGNRTEFSMRNPKIPRLTRSMVAAGKATSAYTAEPFEQIDKELETVQTLCEIGAHQFLRDGTCATELAGAKDRLETVQTIATEQHALYAAEAKTEATTKPERGDSAHERNAAARGARTLDSQGLSSDVDLLAIDPQYNPGAIAVDPAIDVDSMIAVDPTVNGDSGIAVDPLSIAVDSGIAVDASMAIDSKHASMVAPTVDSGIVVDSSVPTVDVDPKVAAAQYNNMAIAVDPNEDTGSFHLDLSSFRRTRDL